MFYNFSIHEVIGQGHSDLETEHGTLQPQDVSKYGIPTSNNKHVGDMLQTGLF